jgi:hypothetical protein
MMTSGEIVVALRSSRESRRIGLRRESLRAIPDQNEDSGEDGGIAKVVVAEH